MTFNLDITRGKVNKQAQTSINSNPVAFLKVILVHDKDTSNAPIYEPPSILLLNVGLGGNDIENVAVLIIREVSHVNALQIAHKPQMDICEQLIFTGFKLSKCVTWASQQPG